MSAQFQRVARDLGCSERTVRRYVGEGLLRSRSLGTGRRELSAQERRYIGDHWGLISGLKKALRTERDVRLAVLFGSVATGEDRLDSDLDVLVLRRSASPRTRAALSMRLREALSRTVHLVDLEQAEASPLLLADILLEGRPLLDRDRLWSGLLDRREEILSEAREEEAALAARAREMVLAARARTK